RHHTLDRVRLDRTLAQSYLDGAEELAAVERLAPARALDHDELAQLHPLEGGEPAAAVLAGAAAADRGALLGRPAVLHLGILAVAIGAAHCLRTPSPRASPTSPRAPWREARAGQGLAPTSASILPSP